MSEKLDLLRLKRNTPPLKAKKLRTKCRLCISGEHRMIRRYGMDICGQCFYLGSTALGWKLGGNK